MVPKVLEPLKFDCIMGQCDHQIDLSSLCRSTTNILLSSNLVSFMSWRQFHFRKSALGLIMSLRDLPCKQYVGLEWLENISLSVFTIQAQSAAVPDLWSGGSRFKPCCVRQHSLIGIDREMFSTVFSFPSAHSRRAFVSSWWKNIHKYCRTA